MAWLDEYGMTPEKWGGKAAPAPTPGGKSSVAPIYTPPASPSASVALSPGFTPDYRSLILGDPAYLAWQNDSNLSTAQAGAQRRAALQALAVRYGGLAPSVKDQYGDIDQTTLDLAKGNQYSDLARLQRNYDTGVEASKRALSARGALQSGELPYAMDQADMARATSEYDLGNEFANAFQQAINNYASTEQGNRQNEYQAIQAAEQSAFSNPMNMPTEGSTGTLVPNWQSKYGEPVYSDSDGNLYVIGPDGHPVPYTPPTFSPTPTDEAASLYGAVSTPGGVTRWS